MEIGFEPMILADRLMRPTGITKLPYSVIYNIPALSVSGIDRRTDHACAEICVVAGLTHDAFNPICSGSMHLGGEHVFMRVSFLTW